jgi:hypothetical protein
MTDVAKLNRLLDRFRTAAEAEVVPLAAMYERALRSLAADAARSFETLTAASWQPQPEGSLLRALDAVAASIALTQERLHRRILRLVTSGPLEALGIAWDVKHPLSADLLAKAGMRTGERLGQAAQPILREIVASAYEQGLSVPDTAALIRASLAAAAPWQAEMLARTDLNGLANGGSVIAARLAGASYKTWEATMDDRTRDSHAEANGQTVPVEHAFDVGGEQLEYPGDPQGSDAETANCRCTVTYGDSLVASGVTPTLTAGGSMATLAQTKWVSDLAFEGEATSDGRYFLPAAWSWREPPLTLMAMTVTADGHDGAFVAGRIEALRKRRVNMDGEALADGVRAVNGGGVFDMGGSEGADVARMVADQTLRGVSVDYAVIDWCFRDPETGELIEPMDATPDQLERAMMGELQFACKKAEILAATVCPTPAFANTRIALTASADGRPVYRLWAPIQLEAAESAEALIASAAPSAPPRAWFETPEPPGKMPLTITPEGRVFGHLAPWDGCHMGFAESSCVTPPRSRSAYGYFHVGEVATDDGETVSVGKLMLASKGGKHAHVGLSKNEAAQHYDDTSMVAAHLRATDGRHGIWVAGALNPRLTASQLRELRALSPSGDWRPVNGTLELICALAVPVPGYPIPRADVEMIRIGDDLQVRSLVASAGWFDADPAAERALADAGLIDDHALEDAKTHALVARAEGGIDGLLALATEGDKP